MISLKDELSMEDYASLDDYEINLTAVNVRIIVREGLTIAKGIVSIHERIVPVCELAWRKPSNDAYVLSLKEMAEQIGPDSTIFVWTEFKSSGEIFYYNSEDKCWHEHGTTKGHA